MLRDGTAALPLRWPDASPLPECCQHALVLARRPYANPSMRLPADPATDVPRLARVTSGASLTSASDVALQRGSYSRSLSARPSVPPHAPSEGNLPSIASTRAVSEPVAGRTLQSALEQMRQQAPPSPAKTAMDVVGVSNPRSSLPAVSDSSTPLMRDIGQERDSGGASQRQSLDGYVLQVGRADDLG